MLDVRTTNLPQARLQARTIQPTLLYADLRAGRRWHWWGRRGWWLHCALVNAQGETWHLRRFVAAVSEACAFLNIQQEDWIWQAVAPGPDQQQDYVPFLMF